jgi:hypothetical protein
MSDQNFVASFTIDTTPEEAFAAINNVRGWWSENIEGSTDEPGGQFTYRYEDVHRCRIEITEFIPATKVVWRVVDNYFNFIEDQSEWTDTEITFEVSGKGRKTEVRFAHLGLVPAYECFDVCAGAWESYINGSLRRLIATGKGHPNKKEEARTNKASR